QATRQGRARTIPPLCPFSSARFLVRHASQDREVILELILRRTSAQKKTAGRAVGEAPGQRSMRACRYAQLCLARPTPTLRAGVFLLLILRLSLLGPLQFRLLLVRLERRALVLLLVSRRVGCILIIGLRRALLPKIGFRRRHAALALRRLATVAR